MKCVIRKAGETRPRRSAIILERGTATLVFKAVPAEVCANCGEAYVAEEVAPKSSPPNPSRGPVSRLMSANSWGPRLKEAQYATPGIRGSTKRVRATRLVPFDISQ